MAVLGDLVDLRDEETELEGAKVFREKPTAAVAGMECNRDVSAPRFSHLQSGSNNSYPAGYCVKQDLAWNSFNARHGTWEVFVRGYSYFLIQFLHTVGPLWC